MLWFCVVCLDDLARCFYTCNDFPSALAETDFAPSACFFLKLETQLKKA